MMIFFCTYLIALVEPIDLNKKMHEDAIHHNVPAAY